jgi:AraC family transcriptional regulator, regulatory protein of adaptative response / DNA-3-methyladenine glycosylase II
MSPVDDDRLCRATVRLSLAYRPPLDWGGLLGYLAARATPGIEAVDARGRYCRSIRLNGHRGYVAVGPAAVGDVLQVELSVGLLPVLVPLLARLRRLFDLDADPRVVSDHLGRDPVLGPLVARRPGLRVAGAADGFELAVRAVLGQQVTVRGATTLAGRLARLLAEPLLGAPPSLAYLPISAERLAGASLASITGIGLPRARAECVLALARAVAGGELSELVSDGPAEDPAAFGRRLAQLPGVGAWTAEYAMMRALHWPDAFPEGDIALRKAMGNLSPARLRAAAESWRPWRAYAAQHLWASCARYHIVVWPRPESTGHERSRSTAAPTQISRSVT